MNGNDHHLPAAKCFGSVIHSIGIGFRLPARLFRELVYSSGTIAAVTFANAVESDAGLGIGRFSQYVTSHVTQVLIKSIGSEMAHLVYQGC